MIDISDSEIRDLVKRVLSQAMGLSAQPSVQHPAERPARQIPPEKCTPPAARILAIGSDHGGFELKEILKAELPALGFEVIDVGAHSKEPVDYPDIAHAVANLINAGRAEKGVIIDGAGIGSCIVANKIPGVRAGLAYDHSSAVNSREHNNTNVLTLGAGLIGVNLAKQILKAWLATEFGGGRHQPRVDKITAIEKLYLK